MSDSRLKIIHLIDSFSQANHGIIEAAIGNAEILRDDHEIDSEIWFPKSHKSSHRVEFRGATPVQLKKLEIANPLNLARKRGLDFDQTIISTHGCWKFPTIVGAKFRRLGVAWIYTPHGMLEPWSLSQKSLRKKIYWKIREYPLAKTATFIRATSNPEFKNLKGMFNRVTLATHGIDCSKSLAFSDSGTRVRVLFMGRLHPKKGALNLAKAWQNSQLHLDPKYQLIIVGGDDGDLQGLKATLADCKSNIELHEPMFGIEKQKLFASCQFFALPSHSEGFPMALLEGMEAGLIPIISDGCNLPLAFEKELAIRVSPQISDIVTGLNSILNVSSKEILSRRIQSHKFISDHFSLNAIAKQQADLYRSLLS